MKPQTPSKRIVLYIYIFLSVHLLHYSFSFICFFFLCDV